VVGGPLRDPLILRVELGDEGVDGGEGGEIEIALRFLFVSFSLYQDKEKEKKYINRERGINA
jgi:hypothetical protein